MNGTTIYGAALLAAHGWRPEPAGVRRPHAIFSTSSSLTANQSPFASRKRLGRRRVVRARRRALRRTSPTSPGHRSRPRGAISPLEHRDGQPNAPEVAAGGVGEEDDRDRVLDARRGRDLPPTRCARRRRRQLDGTHGPHAGQGHDRRETARRLEPGGGPAEGRSKGRAKGEKARARPPASRPLDG